MKKKILACTFFVFVVCLNLVVCGGISAEEPRIGLVYNHDQYADLKQGKDDQFRYRDGIESNGGKAVILSPDENPALTALKVKHLDGLLLPGGDDINPGRYGETPHPKLETVDDPLDEFEFYLMAAARKNGIPMFGICRGEQLLNVFFGGSMFQDIPSQVVATTTTVHRKKVDGRAQPCFHELLLAPQSRFAPLFGTAWIRVNSYHHQGAKTIGQGLRVTGTAPDGVVEIIEGTGPAFVVGVQFHPERMLKEEPSMNVFFAEFLKAAERFQASKRSLSSLSQSPQREK